MKIIFVNLMMGMYRGGGENFDLNLSRELAEMGHEIEIYHLHPLLGRIQLGMPDYSTPRPVRAPWLYQWTQYLHLLPLIGRMRGIRGIPRAIGQLFFELHTFFLLWRRRREDFVVHICGLGLLGMLATKVLGSRVYVRYPGPPSFRVHDWFINNIYGVIANGDAYNSILRRTPEANLIRLEVGVNLGVFTKECITERAREELGLPCDRILLLFVGRFVQIKNVAMLIRALSHIHSERQDIDLVLVGDGSEQVSLISQAENLGLAEHVHFIGRAKGERLKLSYSAADIFLLSSHYDNFPNVILEAMAMELPVIATRVGGVPSQVDDAITGYLVEPDDDRAMARCTLMLAADPEKKMMIGRAGAAIVRENYNWKKTAEIFLKHLLPINSNNNNTI
jgi:glycosyltransferase involved in cell wall biosynthesis